ncbi:MAG: site-specific integrase [Cyanobacteria bacterium P01_E01_bin.6]
MSKDRRAAKGSVSILNNRGWVRFQWRVNGKRYTLSPGIPHDRIGLAIAQQRAVQIEQDIRLNVFDETLDRYRGETVERKGTSVVEVFEAYVEFKRQNLDARTMEKYVGLVGHLKKTFRNKAASELSEDECFNFRDRLMKQLAPITVRERMAMLRSAWVWAGKRRVSTGNPWEDVKVKVPPKARPKPFTEQEIQLILNGFRSSQYYKHYADVVEFIFCMGCRPGEAFGLKWKHLNKDCSVIWIGESWGRGRQKATKTNRERQFTLSEDVQTLLMNRRPERPEPEALVFSSPQGKPIDDHNFRNRAWKAVLKSVGVAYRKPYNTRHSFTSHALAQGATPAEIADITGNSEETIFRNYVGGVEGKIKLRKLWNTRDDGEDSSD